MKAGGNFNIKREVSEKLFNSSAAAAAAGSILGRTAVTTAIQPTVTGTQTASSVGEVGVDNYTNYL